MTASQHRINSLAAALSSIERSTKEGERCCDQLSRLARQLDSLTSPASDASAILTQASENLASTLWRMKDAREKFDTVQDCEPAIQRLASGAKEAMEQNSISHRNNKERRETGDEIDAVLFAEGAYSLTEQDLLAAADSMDILRDAHAYFMERPHWKSTPVTLRNLERVHTNGVESMSLLLTAILTACGPACRPKQDKSSRHEHETAPETRHRLGEALQKKDLMNSVGEYEDVFPLEPRPVREIRAVMDCLGGDGSYLGPPERRPKANFNMQQNNKAVRTEKIGSGFYCNLTKTPISTGFPHLDAYAEARRSVACASLDGYNRQLKAEQKKAALRQRSTSAKAVVDVDSAARDAVRCLEHAMVVVAGEKSIFRCIISTTFAEGSKIPAQEYKYAYVRAYTHVVSAVVDRVMDIIELVFFKEAGIGQTSAAASDIETSGSSSSLSIRAASSAAAAGLRILDGVRILGPSLAKLCELSEGRENGDAGSLAGQLCISIHRTTVKNCARTLENLVKSIQNESSDGDQYTLSSNVVRAIRVISPFWSAYKSVSKRRALPWDQNIADDALDMDAYIQCLISKLLSNLQTKAKRYALNQEDKAGSAKGALFMVNNSYYLLEQFSRPSSAALSTVENDEIYCLENAAWFKEKVGGVYQSQKDLYLSHWNILRTRLTSVEKSDLVYQKDKLLSLESGRLIKSRFSTFNEDFEELYQMHCPLKVIDEKLRGILQNDVYNAFLPRYTEFFEKFSKIQFSKKNQESYLKYPPMRVQILIKDLYEIL